MKPEMEEILCLSEGFRLDEYTGLAVRREGEEVLSAGDVCVMLNLLEADSGDEVRLAPGAQAPFRVAVYLPQIDPKYIYEYEYAPEQNLTTYEKTVILHPGGQFIIENRCFLRLEGDKADWEKIAFSDALIHRNQWDAIPKNPYEEELQKWADECNCLPKEKSVLLSSSAEQNKPLNFLLLADSHVQTGDAWKETLATLRSAVSFGGRDLHGLLHLGDLTDGNVPKLATQFYGDRILRQLRSLGLPLYFVLGNHDTNYFHNNPEPLSPAETEALYYTQDPEGVIRKSGEMFYFRDFPEQQIRCIFLTSFDYREKIRYGYSDRELEWLTEILRDTPDYYCVLVFSHAPLLPRMHHWSKEIRGSRRLLYMLQSFQTRSNGRLLCFIHGHNHGDQLDTKEGFPILSVACGKCEECPDIKPEGSATPNRTPDGISAQLWDLLSVNAQSRTIDLVRFGAGESRHIDAGVVYEKFREEKPMRKVITYGTFDLFHEGHYKLLQRARELGDFLIVGVTTEHFDEARGKVNVVDPIMERIENVRKTGFADEIIIEDHEGQKIEDIQKYGIDVFTEGSDWAGHFDYLKAFCEVIYLDRTPDISSTSLRGKRFKIVRIGIIGTGRITPRFMDEARYVSGALISCAYNPIKEDAERFAKKHDVRVYTEDYEAFLQSVDAVYIASPHETHYDYAKEAIAHHKHVLCEKPMTFTHREAVELYELAAEEGVVLMEGIKTAYCPGFQQLINIAKSGRIGEIRDVEAAFTRLANPEAREMVDAKYGGAFLEFGGYPLLPIFKLFGTQYEDLHIDSIPAENGIDLYTKVSLRYKTGLGMAKTGVGVKSEGQLVIAGTKGYILAQSPWWLTRKFDVRYEDPNKIEHYEPNFQGDGLRYEISEFVNQINHVGGNTYKLTPEESIEMAKVVERFMEIRRSQAGRAE